MSLNGRWVDPLRIQLPPAEPIPEDELAAFEVARTRHLALLQGPAGARPPAL